jgi:hypothetical protein
MEALLSSVGVSTVDVSALLSSEYDSEVGDDSSSLFGAVSEEPPTPSAVLGGQLHGALRQRGMELSVVEREQRRERRRDAETIKALRQENEALRHAASTTEARAVSDLQTYRSSVKAAHARSRAELSELRSKAAALQAEVPALRQRLATEKVSFGQLLIDEPRYQTLRTRADEDVSVVEHVQLRVHELLAAAERKTATVLTAGPAAGAFPRAEVATPAQLYADAAARDLLTARVAEAQARAEQSQTQAEEARSECRSLRAAADAAASTPEGALRASLQAAEQTIAALKAATAECEAKLSTAVQEAGQQKKEAEESTAKAAYLQQDKEYLRMQVRSLEERLATSESRLAKEEGSVAEVQTELARAKEALLASAREQAVEYAQRLESEQLRWQAQSRTANGAQAEAHLAAINTHKDSRELALADAEKWHTRYSELKREHEAATIAAAEAAGRAEAAQAELRADCRLKAFEAERLRVQCEHAFASTRQAQVDADARGEKLDVLKAEYYALKTSLDTRIASLDASNTALAERVKSYEALEEELDRTVLQSGGVAASASACGFDGSATEAPGGGERGELSQGGALLPLIRVPTSTQRRMQQCLSLARDLLTAQRRAEAAEGKLIEQEG